MVYFDYCACRKNSEVLFKNININNIIYLF